MDKIIDIMLVIAAIGNLVYLFTLLIRKVSHLKDNKGYDITASDIMLRILITILCFSVLYYGSINKPEYEMLGTLLALFLFLSVIVSHFHYKRKYKK